MEEEISSVIDRLNESEDVDNYFVVPKRAIFLQSIVNLKLLKREADKIGKHVIIVTQDEVGASMAERSGLVVQSVLEEIEPDIEKEEEFPSEEKQQEMKSMNISQNKQTRLKDVGTDNFYDLSFDKNKNKVDVDIRSKTGNMRINSIQAKNESKDSLRGRIVIPKPLSKKIQPKPLIQPRKDVVVDEGIYKQNLDSQKEKVLERMYSPAQGAEAQAKQSKNLPVAERKIKKIFIGFILLCLIAFVGVAVYLFFPSAKILIEPNIIKNKINLNLIGSSEISEIDNLNIPIKIIDKDDTISFSYDMKGNSSLMSGKKAHGSVVIYNEYDSSPQVLIATTRLESSDGKIFRITKNVTVPGTTNVGGDIKPGAVTVEVTADQSGAEYNLEATNFKIPGFKDGPKYDKFYAKSTEIMTGGSAGEEVVGKGKIAQADIDSAKQKAEAEIKEKIAESVSADLSADEIVLTQAENITITKSSTLARVGDAASSFEYVVTAKVHALIFSQDDVKKIMLASLNNDDKAKDFKQTIDKVEYGTVNADFEKNTLEIRVNSDSIAVPIIDSEQIRSDLLGKNEDQLLDVLKKYSTIKSVKVEFMPTFASRIPQYKNRVSVEVTNN